MGFSFLSGLPEPERKRRLLMPVQAFVDESGGKGQGGHLVLCALVSNSERWADFSDEWRMCLNTSPALRRFKMKDAAGLTGDFFGWQPDARDKKLRELARIINRHAEFLVYCAVDLKGHEKVHATNLPKPLNEPYFWPFHIIIMSICLDLWDLGWRERFEIIFDEEVIFGPRAKAWYPVIKRVVQIREPEAHSIMPIDPLFRSDDEFRPIQAADLFAWCIRRNTNNPEMPVFEWLLEEMQNVSLSDYSNYYDEERMSDVLQESRRITRDGEIQLQLVDEYRKLFGR